MAVVVSLDAHHNQLFTAQIAILLRDEYEPDHRFFRIDMMPQALLREQVGAFRDRGGHATHSFASKPLDTPPMDYTLSAD